MSLVYNERFLIIQSPSSQAYFPGGSQEVCTQKLVELLPPREDVASGGWGQSQPRGTLMGVAKGGDGRGALGGPGDLRRKGKRRQLPKVEW